MRVPAGAYPADGIPARIARTRAPAKKQEMCMKIPRFRSTVLSFVALGAAGLAQEGAKPGYGEKKERQEKKQEGGREVAVTGEVVNLACPLFAASMPGPKHQCGPECLKGRQWAGLVDDATGDLWIVHGKEHASAASKLETWAGQRVTIKGKGTEANGLKALRVDDVAKAEGGKPAARAAEASAAKPREATLTGSVVNVFCALHPASNGDSHVCDAKCLEGERALVGIRDDLSGKIYVAFAAMEGKGEPRTAIETLRPLASGKVRVMGKIVGNLVEVTKAEKA